MPQVHKTAIVDKTAILADGVEVGPYCLIGPDVKVGEGTRLGPHCIVHKDTIIGKNNNFVAACSIGADPQDLKYKGKKTFLVIGDGNIIREYVTLNRATGENEKTVVGNNNLFMTTAHLGHNCVVGNNVVIANAAAIGGHVIIEDRAILGGMVGIHQFCRVGKLSIIGGCSKISQDVPPFSLCEGYPAMIYGLNKIGLARAAVSEEAKGALKRAFKILFADGLAKPTALKKAKKEFPQLPEIKYLIDFVKSSERGISHWIR